MIGGTKWCVFKATEPTRAVVEAGVRERMTRMRTQSVDLLQVGLPEVTCFAARFPAAETSLLLQLHWQDYTNNGYLTALRHLQDLQAEGVITNIGLCNFDAIRTDEICTQLGHGAIVTNQVPVSSSFRPI